jgi:hypothetical protein
MTARTHRHSLPGSVALPLILIPTPPTKAHPIGLILLILASLLQLRSLD